MTAGRRPRRRLGRMVRRQARRRVRLEFALGALILAVLVGLPLYLLLAGGR